MSTLIDAEIVNAVVLAAVLEADLGRHRKITRFRLLRPVLIAAAIVPLFLEKVTTHGGGLTVELAGVAAGLILGLAAVGLMRVYRSGKTGKPVSSAKWGILREILTRIVADSSSAVRVMSSRMTGESGR